MPAHVAARDFPATADALAAYDCVILSDVGANTLLDAIPTRSRASSRCRTGSPRSATMSRQGGGLIMVGGYMTFQGIEGKARYHDTPVEEALPVTISAFDDRRETPQGVTPEVAIADHPIVCGLAARLARSSWATTASSPSPNADNCRPRRRRPADRRGRLRQGTQRRLRLRLRAALGAAGLRRVEGLCAAVAADGGLGGGAAMIAPLNVMRWGDPNATEGRRRAPRHHRQRRRLHPAGAPARRARHGSCSRPTCAGTARARAATATSRPRRCSRIWLRPYPTGPDVLIGHSFGGYLAQVGVLEGRFRPGALVLEDPVSHFADRETPTAMLAWDEANLPHDIDGLHAAQPEMVAARRGLEARIAGADQLSRRDRRLRRAMRPGTCARTRPRDRARCSRRSG